MKDDKPRKFEITCKKCKSTNVRIADDMDMDIGESTWGEVRLICQNCGEREEIARSP